MGFFDRFRKKTAAVPNTAEERKRRTIAYLNAQSIPAIDHLPLLEEESEVRIRMAADIASRALILTYLSFFAEVQEKREEVIRFLKKYDLWPHVSETEKQLFEKELNQQDRVNISWRAEAIHLLLWAINKAEAPGLPVDHVSVPGLLRKLPGLFEDPGEFIQAAVIRPTHELLDQADLLYRLHWATRNAELGGKRVLNLDHSIVYERHYAINWITYYADDWDEITTDT